MTGRFRRSAARRPAPFHATGCRCADCRPRAPGDRLPVSPALLMLTGFVLTMGLCLVAGPFFGGIGAVRFFSLLGGH